VQQFPKPSRPRTPQLPFPPEADQPDLWQRLPLEQRQACRRILSQLLNDVLRHEPDENELGLRSDTHE
jgi:hypothetical protein